LKDQEIHSHYASLSTVAEYLVGLIFAGAPEALFSVLSCILQIKFVIGG